MAARFAERLGHILLAVVELADQAQEGGGFLQGVEVAALQVLDEGDLDGLGIAEVAHHRRQFVEARPLRRPPAPLAGDDLIGRAAAAAAVCGPHHQGLDDALGTDRGGEALDLGLVEALARLIRLRRQMLDGDGEQRAVPRLASGLFNGFAEQGGEALAEAALARLDAGVRCHALSLRVRSRLSSSPARWA